MTRGRVIECPDCGEAFCEHCRKCVECYEDEICPKGPNGTHEAPDTLFRDSGPYTARSTADGKIVVQPKWGQFPKFDEWEGGGPGILSRLGLASKIQAVLNEEMKR